MKKLVFITLLLFGAFMATAQTKPVKRPWESGKLKVSENGRYLQHENGEPFFWLGETGWLLPERTDRDEVEFYLTQCAKNGYNVVQVQTINDVPAYNKFGQSSMPEGWDFKNINKKGVYGYWDHMDYIVKEAEKRGIYIGMVCIWGGLVQSGLMDVKQAQVYGKFLAERYKNSPNIIRFVS